MKTSLSLLLSLVCVILLLGCGGPSTADETDKGQAAEGTPANTAQTAAADFHLPSPISFKNDVMPVFMRANCNSGSCHGAASGKDGFMLSLFGYDPEGDYYRIMEKYVGRRVNIAEPEKSLLLQKAIGAVAHTGGECVTPESKYYAILKQWIEEGAKPDPEGAAEPIGIALEPDRFQFETPNGQQTAKVIATYSDKSTRDITDMALYLTSNEGIPTIGEHGEVTAKQSGEAHVFARFDKFTAGAPVTILPGGSFTWPAETKPRNYIDELVFAKLEKLQILPSEPCSDEHFLRRVSLDIAARLPTIEEQDAFLADTTADKRDRTIDRLLDEPGYAALQAAKWGEILRIYTDTNPGSGTAMKAGWNYYYWLREQFEENQPINRLAGQLVEGNGSNFRDPASNFYTMLPQGKLDPAKLGEDTAQIFLGVRTQCAMCHNHPFDRWTMDDYYGWTSFFTGVRRKAGSEAREHYTYVDLKAEPAKHLMDERPMPHTFLGGESPDITNRDPRRVLADWLTQPENDMFRRNIANRLWHQFFGRGVIEPVDDVRISNPASNEELLAELGRRLAVDYAFDQKKLIRDICQSRVYQLSASANDSNRSDDRQFSHANVRRLRADVLYDAIHDSMASESRFRRSTAKRALDLFEGGRRDSFNQYFFQTFGQATRESVCTCDENTEANIAQALHLINGTTIEMGLTRYSTLVKDMVEGKQEPDAIVTTLYRRTLCRTPSKTEHDAVLSKKPDTTDHRKLRQFYNDVLWALLNSSEFSHNH